MKIRYSYDKIAGQQIQRIETLSDSVFAIAMTLLILDIKVPAIEVIQSEYGILKAIQDLAPKLLTYFLSFITLGIHWIAHSTTMHHITKSDRHFTWINIFLLMSVSTIPFTTAFLSQYITFKFAIGIYWLNIVVIGLLIELLSYYAEKHKLVSINESEIAEVRKVIRNRFIEAQSLYAIGALLCFINTYLSVIVLILIHLNYALALFSNREKREIGT